MIDWHRKSRYGGTTSLEALPFSTVAGTPADDKIKGSKFDDYIDASQGGDDIVLGKRGNDTIYFGATLTPDDLIDGGKGSNRLVLDGDYSTGIDLSKKYISNIQTVELNSHHSYAISGDLDFGGYSSFVVVDGQQLGADDIVNFDGSAVSTHFTVLGGAGDDFMRAPDNPSRSLGDFLSGGDGDDVLIGGAGAMLLRGGGGSDAMTSNGNRTVFDYLSTSDSMRNDPDRIMGFQHGDKIEFRAIDANSEQDGHQSFHFGATAEHVGDIVVTYKPSTDMTIVRAFTDTDARPDLVIHLQGEITLTASDFYI